MITPTQCLQNGCHFSLHWGKSRKNSIIMQRSRKTWIKRVRGGHSFELSETKWIHNGAKEGNKNDKLRGLEEFEADSKRMRRNLSREGRF